MDSFNLFIWIMKKQQVFFHKSQIYFISPLKHEEEKQYREKQYLSSLA